MGKSRKTKGKPSAIGTYLSRLGKTTGKSRNIGNLRNTGGLVTGIPLGIQPWSIFQ
jgi:hypothetical protein